MTQAAWSYVMHENGGSRTAELQADGVVVRSPQEMLDLMGDLMGRQVEELILHEHQLAPSFFDLRTGLAGEILQKCSNYGLRLAVVGDFSRYASQSLQAFIRESNRGRRVFFGRTVAEALGALAERRAGSQG